MVFPGAFQSEVWKFISLRRNKNRLPRRNHIPSFRRALRGKDEVSFACRAVGIDLAINHVKITVVYSGRFDAESQTLSLSKDCVRRRAFGRWFVLIAAYAPDRDAQQLPIYGWPSGP